MPTYKKYLKYIILSIIFLVGAIFYRNLSISKDSKVTIQNSDKPTTSSLIIAKNISTSSLEDVSKAKNIIQQNNKASIDNQKISTTTISKKEDFKLPDPPAGFKWQRLEEIKGWILSPNDWYFKNEKDKTTQAYFVTKEEIVGNGMFKTGITMNIIPSSGIPGGDALETSLKLLNQYNQNTQVEYFNKKESGTFSIFNILTTSQENGDKFKMAVEIVANRNTNTFYLIIFESPIDTWDIEWNNGIKILDTLVLDDEI